MIAALGDYFGYIKHTSGCIILFTSAGRLRKLKQVVSGKPESDNVKVVSRSQPQEIKITTLKVAKRRSCPNQATYYNHPDIPS